MVNTKTIRHQVVGTLTALFAGISYGVYPLLAKYAFIEAINSSTVLFLRFAGCILVMWAYVFVTRRPWKLPLRTALSLVALGTGVYGAMSALNLGALERISASLASLILCFYPVFVTLTLLLLRRETLTTHKAVSLVGCIAGLVLILNISDVSSFDTYGIFLALCASLLYTTYIVLGSFLNKGVESIVAATYIMTGVVLVYGAFGLMSRSISFDLTPAGWAIMTGMAVGSTALPAMLFWIGVQKIGAVKTSIICSIEPLTTVVLGFFILHERLTIQQNIGAILLIAGITVAQIPPRQKQEIPPTQE